MGGLSSGGATDRARLIALLAPALLLAGAYISQYGFGLVPCEMCWWQRYAHFAALPFALLAFVVRPGRIFILLAGLGIATSSAIGAFHAGVEYGWWEGLTRCSVAASSSGNFLEDISRVPMIRCDEVQWSLFHISLAGWNFLFSGASALAVCVLLAQGSKDKGGKGA